MSVESLKANRGSAFGFLAPVILINLLFAFASPAQNVFTSVNSTIYEYTPGGVSRSIFATIPGNAPSPSTLAFDQFGNLFVPNAGNGTIIEIAPNGTQSIFASGLVSPSALAFDSGGNLYASDTDTGTIYKYTPGGVRSTFATGVYAAYGLVVGPTGNLYAGYNSTLYQFSPNGTRTIFANTGQFLGGMAFDHAGNLFVAAGGSAGNILEFTPGGVERTIATGFSNPLNLAFDGAGDLFVSQLSGSGSYIVEFTTDGQRIGFDNDVGAIGLAIQPVPEPAVFWLLAVGGGAILLMRRHR